MAIWLTVPWLEVGRDVLLPMPPLIVELPHLLWGPSSLRDCFSMDGGGRVSQTGLYQIPTRPLLGHDLKQGLLCLVSQFPYL